MSKASIDQRVLTICREEPNLMVPWFLMTSYFYYYRDLTIIRDETFDHLCRELAEKWDEVEHRHKHLITKGDLGAGTGFAIAEDDYPCITKGAAMLLFRNGLEK